ncbi:MAG: SAM-dependent methyltransferase [Chloroflexi bacterium]|nr:SAM-dependent methyltransferase [Chloroflexota bacterium]
MTTEIAQLRPYLQAFDFNGLFVSGLGWDHYPGNPLRITIDDFTFGLEPVAEKAGFAVFVCAPGADGAIPPYPIRRKIEHQVARRAFEHLIIFVDESRASQIWQWVKRETGKPAACREMRYQTGQSGSALLQRIQPIAVSLEQELQGIGITEVASRVRRAMDIERVTRRFYDRFRGELTAFQSFIEGVTTQGDREWYASLMLNRMMFVYFIQKQGFLDGDIDYLRNRLRLVQSQAGEGRYQQFYRMFLLRLFHEGLGLPEAERAPELASLLGRVPFLNGGLFDVHDLERDNPDISIPDEAFEKVFDFFDAYQWHLDDRPDRDDNEINPDVLGYIFEKYINQKQMGAYYTKEDITGYITRNTVIPFLFDVAKRECPVAFGPEGGVWRLLQDDPDRYIYHAVGHGVTWAYSSDREAVRLERPFELPDDIARGIDDISRRGGWNAPASEECALPTETWREVVARRERYQETRAKLASGEVQDINDLITLNLDMEQFAKDVIDRSEGPELLRAFWRALNSVSVLDPTCGSGAFLFAALNTLEPLYSACVDGMRGFLNDLELSRRQRSPKALSDFRQVLERLDKHPSDRYFILKSIVLSNLYGVDIMEEATEICKLRLFLKLVAQLETYDQIEPLPDIDFNIRAGNTLVGFTSLEAVQNAMTVTPEGQHRMPSDEDLAALADIQEQAEIASRAFDMFREQQTALGGEITTAHKAELRRRLDSLRDTLDRHLAVEYVVQPDDTEAYDAWRTSHQPFHWFVEFYGVMEDGGFDVIVGNPPYVEYRTVKSEYTIKGYSTERCGNLYALTWERSINLSTAGHLGMIVPASAVCTDGYAPLRELLMDSGRLVVSSYSDNPGKLFDGMPHNRLQIILLNRTASAGQAFSTIYNRWRPDARPYLFQDLAFFESTELKTDAGIAKIGVELEASILRKLHCKPLVSQQSNSPSREYTIYYTRKLSHFVQILSFIPKIYDANGKLRNPSELKEVHFDSALVRDGTLGILNSSLFSWLVQCFSDCRNLNQREVKMVRFDASDTDRLEALATITHDLMSDIQANSVIKKQGKLTIQQTFPRQSKTIIDELDSVLARHYDFSDEELDFIINYDIKYRMGW